MSDWAWKHNFEAYNIVKIYELHPYHINWDNHILYAFFWQWINQKTCPKKQFWFFDSLSKNDTICDHLDFCGMGVSVAEYTWRRKLITYVIALYVTVLRLPYRICLSSFLKIWQIYKILVMLSRFIFYTTIVIVCRLHYSIYCCFNQWLYKSSNNMKGSSYNVCSIKLPL